VTTGNENPTDQQPILRVRSAAPPPPEPGLVVVLLAGEIVYRAVPVPLGKPFTVGRSPTCDLVVEEDGGVSRRHVELSHDGAGWRFRDLGTNNGTFLDGEPLEEEEEVPEPRCLRLGERTILVPVEEIEPYLARGVAVLPSGTVIGPLSGMTYGKIQRWSLTGDPVLIRGETGTGKMDAAEHYARSCRRAMVEVNAGIATPNLAQATLFGAKKGLAPK
jgi:hypothetical protein